MVKKNTLSILETIKNKLNRLDVKSEMQSNIESDGEFDYVPNAKKEELENTQNSTNEDLGDSLDDDMDFGDDLGMDLEESTPTSQNEERTNAPLDTLNNFESGLEDELEDDLAINTEEFASNEPSVEENDFNADSTNTDFSDSDDDGLFLDENEGEEEVDALEDVANFDTNEGSGAQDGSADLDLNFDEDLEDSLEDVADVAIDDRVELEAEPIVKTETNDFAFDDEPEVSISTPDSNESFGGNDDLDLDFDDDDDDLVFNESIEEVETNDLTQNEDTNMNFEDSVADTSIEETAPIQNETTLDDDLSLDFLDDPEQEAETEIQEDDFATQEVADVDSSEDFSSEEQYESSVTNPINNLMAAKQASDVVDSNFEQGNPELLSRALELLEPKLEDWIKTNLGPIVENVVREEIRYLVNKEDK